MKLVSLFLEIGRYVSFTLFAKATEMWIVWPIMVILLVLVFTLFLSSLERCKIVFVLIRWEFIFLAMSP
ncbi:hypothetical protein LINGRAHAP2_LOCUS32375 [Linum grandiflorum]